MANKKYYTSEVIEFQNGDKTVAKPLTLKKLKAFSEVWTEYNEGLQAASAFMRKLEEDALAKDKKLTKETVDIEALFELAKASGEVPEELENTPSYIDTLAATSLIALSKWGVTNDKEKPVNVDLEYIEEELDVATLSRINEIAGSMQLGDISDDVEGKAS